MKNILNARLNIAEISTSTNVLGPGNRFAIWVQGCPFNCKNCISTDWIPFRVNQLVSVIDVAYQIIDTSNIDGVTLSGGEPFMQSANLVKLLSLIKIERPELNVVVFTGFELEQLIWKEAEELLKLIDVVITGLYIDRKNTGNSLRGSENQKIIFLTDRLIEEKDYFYDPPKNLEFKPRKNQFLMVGIPPKDFIKQ